MIELRPAIEEDFPSIDKIVNQFSTHFSWVHWGSLRDSIRLGELYVAVDQGTVVGFVQYHCYKREDKAVLYNIGVRREYHGQGLGRRLLELCLEKVFSVKSLLTLKCPEDLNSNEFYRAFGFTLAGSEPSRHRNLNIWRLDRDDRNVRS